MRRMGDDAIRGVGEGEKERRRDKETERWGDWAIRRFWCSVFVVLKFGCFEVWNVAGCKFLVWKVFLEL